MAQAQGAGRRGGEVRRVLCALPVVVLVTALLFWLRLAGVEAWEESE